MTSPHSDAALIFDSIAVAPGEAFRAGLQIRLDEGWHTYWKNPGDSGTEVRLTWILPSGVEAGDLSWPVPERLENSGLVSFAYHDSVTLLSYLRVSDSSEVGSVLTLKAKAEWLVCEEACLPAQESFEVPIQIGKQAVSASAEIITNFKTWEAALPKSLEGAGARVVETLDHYDVVFSGGLLDSFSYRMFFPDPGVPVTYSLPQIVETKTQAASRELTLRFEKGTTAPDFEPAGSIETSGSSATGSKFPEVPKVTGLFITDSGAFEVTSRHYDQTTLSGTAHSASMPVQTSPEPQPQQAADLALMCVFALGGGLLLNLMPCVFPMLAVKLLGLVKSANAKASVVRRAGFFYTLGVLASMWALAGGLLALRASGRALGWGFQLQSPLFVATLALLFFVMGFVFLGKLNIEWPARLLPTSLLAKQGNSGDFFSGVLSTVIATPCSAPFMATAIGYALSQPLAVVWAVFTALGFGLALPFLALSMFPRFLRFLPRPGVWMVVLKELLAFPLFVSSVWLIWVFAQQSSLESVAVLLLVCVGLGAAGWAWQSGRLPQRTGLFAGWLIGLGSVGALVFAIENTESPAVGLSKMSMTKVGLTQVTQTGKQAFSWITFEPGLPEKLAAQGKTVFVDYTAAWCLTCKVNEKVVFGSQAVQERLVAEGQNIALVRADWTNEDQEIGASLAQFGRSGVPLYLLYGPAFGGKPEVLPQILTPSSFLAALDRAVASPQ